MHWREHSVTTWSCSALHRGNVESHPSTSHCTKNIWNIEVIRNEIWIPTWRVNLRVNVRRVNVNKTAIFNKTQTARRNLRRVNIALRGVSTPVGKVGLKQPLMASRISPFLPSPWGTLKRKVCRRATERRLYPAEITLFNSKVHIVSRKKSLSVWDKEGPNREQRVDFVLRSEHKMSKDTRRKKEEKRSRDQTS